MEGVKLANDNKIKKNQKHVRQLSVLLVTHISGQKRQARANLFTHNSQQCHLIFIFLANCFLASCFRSLAEFAEQQSKYELKGNQRVINMAADLQFIIKRSVISTNETINITIQGSMQKMIYKKKTVNQNQANTIKN